MEDIDEKSGNTALLEDLKSGEFSTVGVGPLPNIVYDTPTGTCGNNGNVNSSIRGGISGTSILKKRTNSTGANSTGDANLTGKSSGSGSGFTGSSNSVSSRSRASLSLSSSGSGTGYYTPNAKATPRPIWYGRWLFFMLLCMVAAALGYLTYSSLSNNETFLADCVFNKVAEHAITAISTNQDRKKLGMNTMGSVIGELSSIVLKLLIYEFELS